MQRVANGTQVAALPAVDTPSGTPGYFGRTADGAPAPTRVGRDWLNMIQEEIISVIAAAGITLNAGAYNQLLQAIQALITAGTAFLTDTGAANAYVLTPAPAISAYAAGQLFLFKTANANTGASTVNVSAKGAKAIVRRDGSALQAGDIPAGSVNAVLYDGTAFQLLYLIPPATQVYPGAVGFYAQSSAPSGWLACDGSAVSRTTYAALFAALGTAYGAGNGTTTFNLPDARGRVLRSFDPSGVVDPASVFGAFQADQDQIHDHFNGIVETTGSPTMMVYQRVATGVPGNAGNTAHADSNTPTRQGTTSTTAATTGTFGTETRVKGLILLACVKY